MESITRLLVPEVIQALETDPVQVLNLAGELHAADLADLAQALPSHLRKTLLMLVPPALCADLLGHCDEEDRIELFTPLANENLDGATAIVAAMAADDRADLLGSLDEELCSRLLTNLDEEESKDIRHLLTYAENSAGSLMTTDFVALSADTTTEGAINEIRKIAQEMETIYQAYAVDPNATLLGVVSLRDLVTAPTSATLANVMNPNIITVADDADQEDVVRLIAKYDLLSLPVVDKNHRIVGIVTVDDAIDIAAEEATEDAQKLGAVEPLEGAYLATPVSELIGARLPWLLVLFLAVLATPFVLERYMTTHPAAIMLSWFVPLIVSSGGNSGTQSASLIIRALALGRISPNDSRNVLAREAVVGLTLGLALACTGVVALLLQASTRITELILTVACALVAVVTLGALLGSGIPLLLQRFGIDPAVSSTPFIASIVDITGLIIYFEIATFFMA